MSAGATVRTVPVPDGLVLLPFRALRYAQPGGGDLAALTSPPYDIVDAAELARLEAVDPHNVVRLILPRDNAGAGSRYARAAALLAEWTKTGVLRRDDEPALYVYEELSDGHAQRGLLGAVGLADPEAGIVLPHEDTMAGPVADRLALTKATRANLEPIFLLYDGGGAASDVVTATAMTSPLAEMTSSDGVVHRVWAVTAPERLGRIAQDLRGRRALIADGHHRYATYRRYQADRHTAGDGPGPWDAGLAFLVDATTSGPQVHPIHRVIPGLPFDEATRRAAAAFRVRTVDADPCERLIASLAEAGAGGHAFAVSDGRRAVLLTNPAADRLAAALPGDRSAAFRGLDVTVAHLLLIRSVWRVQDREGVVEYSHEADSALQAAAASGGTALLLNPTRAEEVAAVAAAGERMPRKSTLFTPKPRTGLVIRPLDDSLGGLPDSRAR